MQVEKSVEKDAGNMRNVYCLGTSLIGAVIRKPGYDTADAPAKESNR
jgi:hypothetical protein